MSQRPIAKPLELKRAWSAEGRACAVFLALLVSCVLVFAPDYLSGPAPVGEDSSSHILASYQIARHIEAGSPGWWMPQLNLGFPLAHFYQPLPHTATAVLALLLGGPKEAVLAYKLVCVGLLCLLPLTMYAGMRRMQLSRAGAIVATLAFVCLSTPKDFYGLTHRHFLLSGLHTLLWGAVFAPLALSEGVRFLHGRGRFSFAVASFTLLFLSHGLLALGMILVYGFATVFAPLKPSPPILKRFLRLVSIGAVSGACLAFWLLPQLSCSDYFGGWPFSDVERRDGAGFVSLISGWGQGRLIDLRRLPVLTVLSFLGIGVAILSFKDRPANSVMLFGLLLFLIFTAGRKTFGDVVDWVFPPNTRIEGLLRWVAMLQLFLAMAAGIGGEVLGRYARRIPALRGRTWAVIPLLCLPIGALALPLHVDDVRKGMGTFFEELDPDSFQATAEALALEENPGRIYTSKDTGHDTHWAMSYLSLLSEKPMTLSIGVGVQDSLNLYYLSFFRIQERERALALARLLNVRYVLADPKLDLSHLKGEIVLRRRNYRTLRLPGKYGYFELVGEPTVVAAAAPVEHRKLFKRWMRQGYPEGARFLRLPDPIQARGISLPKSNLAHEDIETDGVASAEVGFEVDHKKRGELSEENVYLAGYSTQAEVWGNDAWLVLKVTPHPYWRAEVDGESSSLYTLSPAFMGLPLDPGQHEIVFTFRAPAWQKLAALASPVFLIGLLIVDSRKVRRRLRRVFKR